MLFRKKNVLLIIVLFLLLAFVVPVLHVQAEPSVSAVSAILVEQDSGRVLFDKEGDKQMRIASITKIMTAILAIESGKLPEKVKVSPRAVKAEGSSIYLQEGEKINLEDLVYGLMLRSGNDAAIAIAEHVGGSLEGFVFMMNQKAEQIGMSSTVFSNPHGLDDHEEHYSTAYDMALLTRYAMDNEVYREISSTKIYKTDHPEEAWDRVWRNKNKLLTSKYEYSTGGKTGYTKRAKRTLVSTAEKDGKTLIAVTLAASDDWNDHIHLFEWGFDTFQPYKLIRAGKLADIDHPFYKEHVYINREVVYPLTDEERAEVHISIALRKDYQESWRKSERDVKAGKLTIKLNQQVIVEVPIYYSSEKVKPTWWELFKNTFLVEIEADSYG